MRQTHRGIYGNAVNSYLTEVMLNVSDVCILDFKKISQSYT